ncbi:MAG: ATP-binding protein [Betaproteobacteria bacterium]|nr:ATP-binding protein [Betaproteobacteria bacterium]
MKMILMRGVSGSGKSTLARKLAENHENSVILSTDDYFMVEGKYVFDPSSLGKYHKMNQDRARWAMLDRISCVIIDNTNTQAWEMRPYVETALELGYEIEIHEPEPATLEEIMRRQESRKDAEKNLPIETVKRMLARFEKEVTVETILNSRK